MRRVWFTKEMKGAIVKGRKTATTRNHPLKLDEDYLAVSGSWFKAEPFAVIRITGRLPIILQRAIDCFYYEEGFDSGAEMLGFLIKKRFFKKTFRSVEDDAFFHRFEVKAFDPEAGK